MTPHTHSASLESNPGDPFESDAYDSVSPAPKWGLIASAVRGRVHWLIILSVTLGLAGAILGYWSSTDKYVAYAMLEVKPTVKTPFESSSDHKGSVGWKQFLNFQFEMLQSSPVKSMALQSDRWRKVADETGIDSFDDVKVTGLRGTYLFTVSGVDGNPKVAQASVNATLDAFLQFYEQRHNTENVAIIQALIELRRETQQRLRVTTQMLQDVGGETGRTNLLVQFESQTRERERVGRLLEDARLRWAIISPDREGDFSTMSVAELAAISPRLALMRDELYQLQDERARLGAGGRGENHPLIERVDRRIVNMESRIEQTAAELRVTPDAGSHGAVSAEQEQLAATIRQLTKRFNELHEQTMQLGEKAARIQELDAQIDGLNAELKEIQDRVESINREAPPLGRFEVVASARKPSQPGNPEEAMKRAAVGGVGGMMSGLALIVLIGWLGRSVRYVEDVVHEAHDLRVLGVLPTLPGDQSDPEQSELAAHTIHHIRTLLQLGQPEAPQVLAVTGASAGSGKSSLTMALGLSFVASGSKTLLIDADVVGAGLSSRVNGTGTSGLGLFDACDGAVLDECIISAGPVEGLDILPVGSARPTDAGSLSPQALHQIVEMARERYAIILIDSGPALGSLEASMAATEADTVVMVVSRGDSKSAVDHSVAHLQRLGAPLAGVVFNHALHHDVERSRYGSVVSTARKVAGESPRMANAADAKATSRFGPLGMAVACYSGQGRRLSGPALGAGEHVGDAEHPLVVIFEDEKSS